MNYSTTFSRRVLLYACAVIALATSAIGQSSNSNPVLAISPDSSVSNRLNASVSNAMLGRVYRIEKRSSLNGAGGWQFHLQTTSNFSIVPQSTPSQFYRAV